MAEWLERLSKAVAARSSTTKCPLCGGRVVYEGAINVECATHGCVNASADAKPEKVPDWGSYAWALVKHASGERVGYFDGYTFIEANPDYHKHDGPYRGWTLI